MIIPRVQQEKLFNETISLPEVIGVKTTDETGEKAIEVLKIFMPSFTFEQNEDSIIEFVCDGSLKPEEYILTVTDKIEITYSDFLGARNGCATLAQMVADNFIKKCEIKDYPKFAYRSFMMDLGRGVGRKEEIKEVIVRLAMLKYNNIHFHMMDSQGFAWQSAKHPNLAGPKGDKYSMEYFKGLNDLCVTLGLNVVPELDVPGHMRTIFDAYPNLQCETDKEERAWTVCAGNEDFYSLCYDLIGELIEMFPSCKYVHIGGDEVEMTDIKRWCYWDVCPKCQKLGNSKQEIHYHLVKRVYDIVKSYGKEVMMWNDWIDISKPSPLPKDIVIEFWRVAQKNRGPYEGCSMQGFLEQGYTVINAHYPETYVDFKEYASPESLSTWLPTLRPETEEQYHNMIIGGETCAWEYGNIPDYRFYRYTLPSPLGLFADRLWNGTYKEYDREYETALTKAVLGNDCPKDLNIFEYLGTIMPPAHSDIMAKIENVTATDEELDEVQLKLIPLAVSEKHGRYLALAYIECLLWIKNNR